MSYTGLVGANSVNTPAQPLDHTSQEAVMQEFSQLLKWFVIALIIISVISLIRIFSLRHKMKTGKRKQPAQKDHIKIAVMLNRELPILSVKIHLLCVLLRLQFLLPS